MSLVVCERECSELFRSYTRFVKWLYLADMKHQYLMVTNFSPKTRWLLYRWSLALSKIWFELCCIYVLMFLSLYKNNHLVKARGGGGGSRGQKIWFFDSLFVANTSRDGSCGTKIINHRDCLDPKNEVYIFHWNITLKLNIKIWRLSKATHVSSWVSLTQNY